MKKLMMIIILLFLVGCNDHEHKYETKVVEATCLNGGYTIYSCGCGYSYQDDFVNALDHDYGEWVILKEATCIDSGRKEKYCSRCNGVVATPIGKLDCKFRYQVVNQPTYYEEGLLANVCEHGLMEDSIILPSYSSGEYETVVIKTPNDSECGIRSHRIIKKGTYYTFSEEIELINDDRFKYEYSGIDVILKRGTFVGGELVIPEGVTVISKNAFSGLSITKLTLPSTLKEISYEAFRDCNIESLHIPSRVADIKWSAFLGNELKNVTVDVNNTVYYSVDNSIITKSDDKLVLVTNSIPSCVKILGEGVFYGSSIEEIIIPEGIIGIEERAFENCSNLKSVYIPSTLTYLGHKYYNENVFAMCPKLETIVVSTDNKVFKSVNNSIIEMEKNNLVTASNSTVIGRVQTIGANAFKGLSITSIVIPDTVYDIYGGAFEECLLLEEVVLPERVNVIHDSVFKGCISLKKINLDNITNITNYAFYGSGLTEVRLDKIKIICMHSFGKTNIEKLYIGSSITQIDINAFKGCINIEEIVIEDNKYFEIVDNSLINSETKEVIATIK